MQPEASSPGRVQGQSRETLAKSSVRPPLAPALRTVQIGVGDQVRSFVAWMLDGVVPARLSDKRVVQNYLRWAEEWNVVPIPASILLHALKDHPQVRFARDRLLDAHGRALRNANGTPLRGSFYTFAEKHAKRAKRPGTVPVTEMVAAEPLRARPKPTQAATQQPEQHVLSETGQQPLPCADAPKAWASEAHQQRRIAA